MPVMVQPDPQGVGEVVPHLLGRGLPDRQDLHIQPVRPLRQVGQFRFIRKKRAGT